MVRDINSVNGPRAGTSNTSNTSKSAKGNESAAVQTPAQQTTKPTGAAGPAQDTVKISEQAKILKSVESQLKQLSDVDFLRVEELRNAIAEGRYEIDTQHTADRMLQSDAEFDSDPGS